MNKIKNYILMLLACGLAACADNNDVEDMEPWTEEYELPQGKSDADDRIVDYYNKYGTYILYEYSYLDYRYELGDTYEYTLPDPAYVGDMLDLLEEIWFGFYSTEFHKKYMPLKIMLAESFKYVYKEDGFVQSYFLLSGESCIGVGFCSDTLRKLTPATKLGFKNKVQETLWDKYSENLEFPDEFFEVSDYTSVADVNDPSSDNYARKRGFIADYSYYGDEWCYTLGRNGELDKQTDLRSFLFGMVLRTSEEWATDLEYPLVKKKYDILRDWIQEKYGFDIIKIGDVTYK